ncbi:MAG: class I SAM-dependent methyltransferase [Candidatus Methylumidiphilus sp.]
MSVSPKHTDRLKKYLKGHETVFGSRPASPTLEFGCGAGDLLIAAHEMGMTFFGIDVSEVRLAEFQQKPDSAKASDFFRLYDGDILPFRSEYFGSIYSWFVLENILDLSTSLRELVRVTKVGGTLCLITQETFNYFDGHCNVYWPPYFPRRFFRPYMEEHGFDGKQIAYMESSVFYVTTSQISSILAFLGCKIVSAAAPLNEKRRNDALDNLALNVDTERKARILARQVKQFMKSGEWSPPERNIIIWAQREM